MLCGTQIGNLVSDRKRQTPTPTATPATPATAAGLASANSFNVPAVKEAICEALGVLTDEGEFFFLFFLVGLRVLSPIVHI